jgi:outer membrane receptor for ferrienterochelin and colicins
MKKIIFLLLAMSTLTIYASVPLQGYIYEEDANGKKIPLPMVNVHWAGTQTGTFTNEEGFFKLERVKGIETLVISYAGYDRDSLRVRPGEQSVSIGLTRNIQLQKIVITARQTSTYMDHFNPLVVQHITGAELHKAACCNLGESFETNASVDVSYGDAISGAKKIELLGLTGLYTQLMIENIPDYQGFGRTFGLNYIPGHWLESISVSKGATSVLSGNESLTGQISANFKKPEGEEAFYLNLYGNNHGHLEFNTNSSQKINKNLSTIVLAHGGYNSRRLDHNNDGFMDEPLTARLHLMNRWTYLSPDGSMMTHWGISALSEDRFGGQQDYQKGEGSESGFYGFEVLTRRYGAFAKGGYTFKGRAATNLAVMNNFAIHEQSSIFGKNHHHVRQISANHRAVFDTYVGNTNHVLHTGASFQYQGYDEHFNDSIMNRYERIPGAFVQYTYTSLKKFTLMSGFRADFNNLYGFQWTPRLHLRYQPYEHTTIRLSAGKGYRTVHMFSENLFLLASARSIVFEQLPEHEIGWNYGLHMTRTMKIFGREGTLNAELFRTDFESQIIIDMDRDFEHIYVYQLDGSSFANNAQVDFTFEPLRKFDMLLAFRVSDVRSTVNGELVPLVFSKRYKGLVNFSYRPGLEKWQFDFTAQFNGPSRLPANEGLPAQYQRQSTSPGYTIFNAQITKYFRHWNVYFGGENLSNFVQHHPIIAADDPFGKYFDASQIWGPVLGRKIYIGMRFTMKQNK